MEKKICLKFGSSGKKYMRNETKSKANVAFMLLTRKLLKFFRCTQVERTILINITTRAFYF